ncbi:MAG: type II toxin-antitoxin system RelB/DinJ family antitoxin [Oscillibacter sp.]|nr:type II toxin-antitoxin system RelB/DinJ family antitoxin [Oscillibacter sp.]
MKSVSITFQADEDIKKQAEALYKSLGMSLSAALNLFLKQSVVYQGVPFAISEEIPNEVTFAAMEAAENGVDMYGPFDTVDELMEALNA